MRRILIGLGIGLGLTWAVQASGTHAGGLVHYVDAAGVDHPAIVVHVVSRRVMDLTVFLNWSADGPDGPLVWQTAVPYRRDGRPGSWHDAEGDR